MQYPRPQNAITTANNAILGWGPRTFWRLFKQGPLHFPGTLYYLAVISTRSPSFFQGPAIFRAFSWQVAFFSRDLPSGSPFSGRCRSFSGDLPFFGRFRGRWRSFSGDLPSRDRISGRCRSFSGDLPFFGRFRGRWRSFSGDLPSRDRISGRWQFFFQGPCTFWQLFRQGPLHFPGTSYFLGAFSARFPSREATGGSESGVFGFFVYLHLENKTKTILK